MTRPNLPSLPKRSSNRCKSITLTASSKLFKSPWCLISAIKLSEFAVAEFNNPTLSARDTNLFSWANSSLSPLAALKPFPNVSSCAIKVFNVFASTISKALVRDLNLSNVSMISYILLVCADTAFASGAEHPLLVTMALVSSISRCIWSMSTLSTFAIFSMVFNLCMSWEFVATLGASAARTFSKRSAAVFNPVNISADNLT
ncbi:unknown [Singapore grouper iridovirus]|uniref:Uncharacterized protein n=1 Tax=Singapore grouper iridovirus TaxID=262968 RepID=Q5YFM1_9VIRU|nr:hypothetical protein ORF044L [Singapore grouper iridovirus]AAS18059.1 unknown [Singapore grouper iridovirus]WAU86753.1 hypothetical protein ORF044L [Singapore grouper iridovirus]